jgi:hypothetical protein
MLNFVGRSCLLSANFARFSARTKMVSSFVNEKAEPDLYQHEVNVNTQNDKAVTINCVFMVSHY